jgi:hypothetical protein
MSIADPTATPVTLSVIVNEELTLDAGSYEPVPVNEGERYLIQPPRVALFDQLIEYLWRKPDPLRLNRRELDIDALAATALCLRWGTYLAVLLDREKPLWSLAPDESVSHLGQEEMLRINLEASTAFARWIDLHRQGTSADEVRSLARRAVVHLPGIKSMGGSAAEPDNLIGPRSSTCGTSPIATERLLQAQEASSISPVRVIANTMINYAYRTGPIEQLHTGQQCGYPLGVRRLTAPQESQVFRSVNAHMRKALRLCHRLTAETPPRSRADQAVAFALSPEYTPRGWSLTDTNHAFHLAAPSPDWPLNPSAGARSQFLPRMKNP